MSDNQGLLPLSGKSFRDVETQAVGSKQASSRPLLSDPLEEITMGLIVQPSPAVIPNPGPPESRTSFDGSGPVHTVTNRLPLDSPNRQPTKEIKYIHIYPKTYLNTGNTSTTPIIKHPGSVASSASITSGKTAKNPTPVGPEAIDRSGPARQYAFGSSPIRTIKEIQGMKSSRS